MVRPVLLLISILFWTAVFSQKSKTVDDIESILKNNPGLENYRYWYGGNEYSICDFRMDTVIGKLSKFIYTTMGSDTVLTEYYFINNYLAKVCTSKKKDGQITSIGTYYFNDNKVIFRVGRDIKLVGKGYFNKITPKQFEKQLKYIYFQYEYLNPSQTRYQINVPKLLKEKREEIDKRKSYYN